MAFHVMSVRLDLALREGLEAEYRESGVLPSEQVRRAIQQWLKNRGHKVALAVPQQGRRTDLGK